MELIEDGFEDIRGCVNGYDAWILEFLFACFGLRVRFVLLFFGVLRLLFGLCVLSCVLYLWSLAVELWLVSNVFRCSVGIQWKPKGLLVVCREVKRLEDLFGVVSASLEDPRACVSCLRFRVWCFVLLCFAFQETCFIFCVFFIDCLMYEKISK